MSAMDHLAWLLPLLPLLGGVAWRPIRARWGERVAGWVAWTSCALAAIGWGLACSALVGAHNGALGLGTSLGIRHPLRLTLNLGFEIDIVSVG